LALAFTARARADEAQPTAAESAEALFREGRAMLESGDDAGACPRFERSLHLDPNAVGARLNLAICSEHLGRLAKAWFLYREVAVLSRDARPDRVRLSEARAQSIEPRLSHLTISLAPDAAAQAVTVRLDGATLDRASFQTPMPVDGGDHTLEVAAPGKQPHRLVVSVANERDERVVTIMPLAEAPAAVTRHEQAPSSSRRVGVAALGVGGLVVLAVGAGFGILALTSDKPADACASPSCSPADRDRATRLFERVNTYGWVADIAIPVGAVATAAGAVLFFTAPSKATGAVRWSAGAHGVRVDGTF
jgi:hypothetical protein